MGQRHRRSFRPQNLADAHLRLQSPLVWTTVTLTLHAGGAAEAGLTGASAFPRHWVYGGDDVLALKAPTTDQREWTAQPSQRHTPWGNEDSPVVTTAAETALERELATVIMRGGPRPVVRELPAGSMLTEQGQPGDSLYLLLDGIVAVDVDGAVLTELGPGVVVGERAVLEGGARTATLTAVTKIRVAEAAANTIDPTTLRQLSTTHQREADPTRRPRLRRRDSAPNGTRRDA